MEFFRIGAEYVTLNVIYILPSKGSLAWEDVWDPEVVRTWR
jgi:hypothetical protein